MLKSFFIVQVRAIIYSISIYNISLSYSFYHLIFLSETALALACFWTDARMTLIRCLCFKYSFVSLFNNNLLNILTRMIPFPEGRRKIVRKTMLPSLSNCSISWNLGELPFIAKKYHICLLNQKNFLWHLAASKPL